MFLMVAALRLISPDNVPVQYGGLSRPTDSDFTGSDAKCTEMIVKPGAKHTIEIPVAEVRISNPKSLFRSQKLT